MRSRIIVVVSLWLCLSVLVYSAKAQLEGENPHIFKLRISQCIHDPSLVRVQTGFRLAGTMGIVTALHGVANCEAITAIAGTNEGALFTDLDIVQVDTEHDVAVLSSAELESAPLEGLAIEPEPQEQHETLAVVGYPLGIQAQLTSRAIALRDPPKVWLLELIPPSYRRTMRERDSPSLDIEVLSIEGHLLPGHSGAPILNQDNQVIGIANGGLQSGSAEISWVIPWHDIALQTVEMASVREKLDNLAHHDPHLLFAIAEEGPPTPAATPATSPATHSYTILVRDAATGDPIGGAKVRLVVGNVPNIRYTDSEGTAVFSLTASAGSGQIWVEVAGYERYDRYVYPLQTPSEEIRLRASTAPGSITPNTPGPTPTHTPTATATPSATATFTFTTAPANTPTPTNTPVYQSGLITYVSQEGDKRSLHVLNRDGMTRTLVENVADVRVLDISPDRKFLAVAIREQTAITPHPALPRFLAADALYVVSVDGWRSAPLTLPRAAVNAAYTANGSLVVASYRNATIAYTVAEADGSNPRQLYQSFYFGEGFDANEYDWPVGEYSTSFVTGNRQIIDGKYHWEVKAHEGFVGSSYPAIDAVSNFYATVETQRVRGSNSASYGVAFRHDDSNYYIFRIRDTQQYAVELRYAGERITLIGWRSSATIQPGAVNRLAVKAEGAHFTFYINGEYVGEVEDSQLTLGNVGLMVSLASADEEALFEFDNFEVSPL